MSFDHVRRTLVTRLDQGDRGDRAWFIVTRVHVSLSRLRGIAEYLECHSGGAPIRLTEQDYYRLAKIIETDTPNPGIQLRRHHLLVMDKPLRSLRRVRGNSWNEIALTDQGRQLANADDPAAVLEQALSAIRFAVEPWSPRDRARQYAAFDLAVYDAMKDVLAQCDDYIDRDEFDFFVSRMRTAGEVQWAIDAVHEYRTLPTAQQVSLRTEVRRRLPNAKIYQNWRDIALHTFSLFSLGTSMVREGTRLLLTSRWSDVDTTSPTQVGTAPLRIPEPPELPGLPTPPSAPASNDGSGAESFVAKVLRSRGWDVTFYTNRRGYGFDLWARRGNREMVVEVKSSLNQLDTVTLTRTEFEAAGEYGESFVLALVEHVEAATPQLTLVQNPVSAIPFRQRASTAYTATRKDWQSAAS